MCSSEQYLRRRSPPGRSDRPGRLNARSCPSLSGASVPGSEDRYGPSTRYGRSPRRSWDGRTAARDATNSLVQSGFLKQTIGGLSLGYKPSGEIGEMRRNVHSRRGTSGESGERSLQPAFSPTLRLTRTLSEEQRAGDALEPEWLPWLTACSSPCPTVVHSRSIARPCPRRWLSADLIASAPPSPAASTAVEPFVAGSCGCAIQYDNQMAQGLGPGRDHSVSQVRPAYPLPSVRDRGALSHQRRATARTNG